MSHDEAGGFWTGTVAGPRPWAAVSDTSPEAQRVLDAAYRAMSPERKWRRLADDFRLGRRLHDAGLRLRRPEATPAETLDDWIGQLVGEGPWRRPLGELNGVDQPPDNLAVVREVIDALDGLGIAYALGGSFASSLHGIGRYTRDADLSVEAFPGREGDFVARFGDDYYVSPDAVRLAVRERSSFNVIHTLIGFKVDLFVCRDREFERSALSRRVRLPLSDDGDRAVAVLSAEDIVLHKLEWYRLGSGSSDRQWSDVLGVLRVQAGRLDEAYLDRWAVELGVVDLLAGARADAGAGRA